MAIIVRRNGGLNAAARGLERGIGFGLGIGLDVQRQRKMEEEAQFQRQQALDQARRIDAEIQRENAERAAAQEAIGEIAAEPTTQQAVPWMAFSAVAGGMSPAGAAGGAAGFGAMQQDKRARLAEIAKRMDPRTALVFLNEAKQREIDAAIENDRSRLRDEIARAKSEGSFRSDPDSIGMLTPEEKAEGDAEFETGLDRIAALAADPNSNPAALRAEYGALRKSRIVAEGKSAGRFQTLQQLKDQVATMTTPPTPRQAEALATMQRLFQMSPEVYDDPRAMQEFQRRWSDAIQGYTMVGNERIKFEDEEVVRRLKIENERARNALLEAQRQYYEAGATQRETPKPDLTKKERMDLALKMRSQANDPETPEAEAEQLRRQAEALERGQSWTLDEAREFVPDAIRAAGSGGRKGWTMESAQAEVRRLLAEGKTAEAEALAEEAAKELAGANGG